MTTTTAPRPLLIAPFPLTPMQVAYAVMFFEDVAQRHHAALDLDDDPPPIWFTRAMIGAETSDRSWRVLRVLFDLMCGAYTEAVKP